MHIRISHGICMACGGVSSHSLTRRVTFVDFESGFCFALLFLVPLTIFLAIYSKCYPRFGIIIAMCTYQQRGFVPKMQIREGHLYLHSILCEGSPAQSNFNVWKHGDNFLAFLFFGEGVDLFPILARLSMVIVAVNSTAVITQSFFPSQSKTFLTRQSRSRNPFLSLSLSLSLSFFNCTATMFWISWLESDSLLTILAWWSEMNRTTLGWVCRQRQTVRWSFFMRSFHCAWLKKLQGHRNRKNGEVPSLKPKETGDCMKCKRFRGSGDHPSSDRFVSLDTRSKFIAMGRRLAF